MSSHANPKHRVTKFGAYARRQGTFWLVSGSLSSQRNGGYVSRSEWEGSEKSNCSSVQDSNTISNHTPSFCLCECMPDTSSKMFQDILHAVICERQLQIYTLANWGIFIISISCSASDNCMKNRPRVMKWLYTIDAIVISKCIINTFNTSMWCFNCVWQPINVHTAIYFAEAKHILNKLLLLAFSKNSITNCK